MITPNEIHKRRRTWQEFLESRWDKAVVHLDEPSRIGGFLGCGLAACAYTDPDSFDISVISSDQDIRNILLPYFYMHPMNLHVLEEMAIEGYSGYDLGWSMIAMPLYPKEYIDQRTFWDKVKERIGIK